MAFAKVLSAQTSLLNSHIIDIEVDLSPGLHAFSIVGLPDKAVEEARDRISAAIKNSGFKSPKAKNQKVVISLAPADIKKEGPFFDLGMALAYLLASKDISFDPGKRMFIGELSLDGAIRRASGVLPLVEEARRRKIKEVYVPKENAREAALIAGISIFPASHLRDVVKHLNTKKSSGEKKDAPVFKIPLQPVTEIRPAARETEINFRDIKGQEAAKRGLEIAAAGGHNATMWGPPGTGKTMLAKAFSGILPDLSFEEILEITGIHSVAGVLRDELVYAPPLRSPHHTSSYVSVVGGGAVPKPGEITLAHRGVLFLDEFPEFDRRVLEALRQPLEDKVVNVSRSRGSARFPANFILIAAMNPCPCGNFGVKGKECVCMPSALSRYQRKISGPIMDRIDIWLPVGAIRHDKLSQIDSGDEETGAIRARVGRARERQKKRFAESNLKIKTNSEISARNIISISNLEKGVVPLINSSAQRLGLSPRSYHKVIKLARTIADLDNSNTVAEKHMLEALQYRPKSFSL